MLDTIDLIQQSAEAVSLSPGSFSASSTSAKGSSLSLSSVRSMPVSMAMDPCTRASEATSPGCRQCLSPSSVQSTLTEIPLTQKDFWVTSVGRASQHPLAHSCRHRLGMNGHHSNSSHTSACTKQNSSYPQTVAARSQTVATLNSSHTKPSNETDGSCSYNLRKYGSPASASAVHSTCGGKISDVMITV